MKEYIGWEWEDLLPHVEDDIRTGAFEMAKRSQYRWVEPETVIVDEQGHLVKIPEHQEQGEYVGEASIRGYVIVLWNGKQHLIKETDIVAIFSE